MFHWICPECGREIAPTVRECPACDAGAGQAELVLAGVVEASARTARNDAPRAVPQDAHPLVVHEDAAPSVVPQEEPLHAVQREDAPLCNEHVEMSTTSAPADASLLVVPQEDAPPTAETAIALRNLNQGLETPQESSSAPSSAPLIPEILDSKAAEIKAVEARAAEILGAQAGFQEASKAVPTRTVESKAIETRSVDSRTVEAKALEGRTIEFKAVESKVVESKIAETKVAESRALDSKVSETSVPEKGVLESQAFPPEPAANAQPLPRALLKRTEAHQEEPVASPVAPAATNVVMPAPEERVPWLAKLSRLTPPKIAASREVAARSSDLNANLKADSKAEAETQTSIETTPDSRTAAHAVINAVVNTGVAPEAVAQEPLLPSLDPPAPESLNTLLAAAGILEDEAQAEPSAPPVSGKLPLPLRPARLTPAALSALLLPASKTQAPPPPETPREHTISGLPLVQSRFPLARPSARPLIAAAPSQPTALPPKSAGVRAPRSPRPLVAPKMAPLVKYSPLANHPLRPAAPPEDLRRTQTAPRITLPGPMLTRSLASFQDRALSPIFLEERAFRKRFTSGWLVTILVVGTVVGVGFSNLFSVAPHPSADTRPAASAERATPDAAGATDTANAADTADAVGTSSPAPPRAGGSNPLSKSIEVTGIRLVMDPSRKAEVQYLVVNHSPARFSDATVYVTLHAAGARAGQPPLCRFSFAAPNLGPFEAKEMISAIEKTNRPLKMPDWQALRAEIEIGQ